MTLDRSTDHEGAGASAQPAFVDDDRTRGLFRVRRSSMTSQDVFDAETGAVFRHSWLYLGHESEIPRVGDYRVRRRIGKPLLMVRDTDSRVRVLYNVCTHRGSILARQESGNAQHFQCMYHGWTFNTKGTLTGTPMKPGYPPCFDRTERNLVPVANVDSYRGFVFINFDPDADGLVSYMAAAREYFDLVADQSPTEMRILPGTNQYSIKANWKLLIENSLDSYHALPVHQTYIEYMASFHDSTPITNPAAFAGRVTDLGNGHAVLDAPAPFGRPIAKWDPMYGPDAKPEIDRIRRELERRLGEERAKRIADETRLLLFFPNLVINDIAAITIRYVEPVAPNKMDISAWAIAPTEETGAALARRLDGYLTFLGPGGFATPDDVEVLEACQEGLATSDVVEWSDISRGTFRLNEGADELQMRTFWRTWNARMTGQPQPARIQPDEIESPLAGGKTPAVDNQSAVGSRR